MKILMVDDSIATLDTMKAVLEQAGHVVFTANTHVAAISHLDQRPEIDLILTDYYLPDGNGFELATHVRAIPKAIPVVILTAADADTVDTIRKAVEPLTNVMVLRKPIEPDHLLYLLSGIRPDLRTPKPVSSLSLKRD